MQNYTLWLDDIRTPHDDNNIIIARNSSEAINYVKDNGFPMYMYLDHDLGGDDTTMVFLKAITPFICDGTIISYINNLIRIFS